MATSHEEAQNGRPWNLEAVQNLLSTLNVEPPSTATPPASHPELTSDDTPSSSSEANQSVRRGIGDLTPVLDLLKNYPVDAQPFRELDRLPLPSWPSKYTAKAPSKDSYQSDGAALYRSSRKKTKSAPKIVETSDDDYIGGDIGSENNEIKTKVISQKRAKKDQKRKSIARQTVSDGEASKSTIRVLHGKKPASKAATHQATTPNPSKQAAPQTASIIRPSRPISIQSATNVLAKAVRILEAETTPTPPRYPLRKNRSKSDPSTVNSWLQRDKVHRDLLFRIKLIDSFPEDRVTLSQTVPFRDNPLSVGIHVFIDFSNIWIGFMTHIKSMMGMHPRASLTYEHRQLSFESLVFLLERGRPVGRSILGGSLPWLSAFDTARRVGYECNILEKVLKDRTLTDQQKRQEYKAHRLSGGPPSTPTVSLPNALVHKTYGATSTARPEIFVPSSVAPISKVPASRSRPGASPEKWVEQGVDEILHMKMLESLLDCQEPSTIVLATGDGAKAEYSDGFTKVLERALLLGWNVELVSWESGLSSAYRQFMTRWQEQFRFVPLDEFAEYLLEPSPEAVTC